MPLRDAVQVAREQFPMRGLPDTCLVISHAHRMAINDRENRRLAPEGAVLLELKAGVFESAVKSLKVWAAACTSVSLALMSLSTWSTSPMSFSSSSLRRSAFAWRRAFFSTKFLSWFVARLNSLTHFVSFSCGDSSGGSRSSSGGGGIPAASNKA